MNMRLSVFPDRNLLYGDDHSDARAHLLDLGKISNKMIRKTLFCLALVSLAALGGCRQDAGVEVIRCDTDNAPAIEMPGSGLFTEISLDPSPMLPPNHLVVPGDGSVYFLSRDTLFCYSLADGRRERIIGRRGRAKNEFSDAWEFWIDGDELYIDDINAKKMLRFSRDGEWQDSKLVARTAQAFCRLDQDHWVGRMNFGGVRNEYPQLGIFDNDLEFVRPEGSWMLLSGSYAGYPFCRNQEGVLYNPPFSEKIIQVTPEGSYEKYQVEFLDGTMKLENYEDEFALLAEFTTEMNRRSFSLQVRSICEDGKYLNFRYYSTKRGVMLVLYDLKKKEAHCVNIQLPEEWSVSESTMSDGKIYLSAFEDKAGVRIWVADAAALVAAATK